MYPDKAKYNTPSKNCSAHSVKERSRVRHPDNEEEDQVRSNGSSGNNTHLPFYEEYVWKGLTRVCWRGKRVVEEYSKWIMRCRTSVCSSLQHRKRCLLPYIPKPRCKIARKIRAARDNFEKLLSCARDFCPYYFEL